MAVIINSFALSGVNGYLVEVETKTISGKPSITIVGLGDTAIKEARERLQAALNEAEFEFPKMKIVINLAPGNIKKSGSHFDLAMALGLLVQTDQVNLKNLKECGFIGELSLNGFIRPCPGVLPMVVAARDKGIKRVVVPKGNLKEALLVKGIEVYGFDSLVDVVQFLAGEKHYGDNLQQDLTEPVYQSAGYDLDFREVQGQDALIQYIMVAAAGGHNMLMVGSPGCGKSMVARRIPTILPNMSEKEALEVTKIYSVAGLLHNSSALITQRPFRAPHHNASTNSLVGGGNNAIPGEISLAHNGVLFLDEIAEFGKKSLEALRQPMEDQCVTVSRVNQTNTYPSRFMLVAAMNPCACGYYGETRCRCSDYEVLKYRRKISGPILDRMDIQKYVQPVNILEMPKNAKGKSSSTLRERVEQARSIQSSRFRDCPSITCNAQMNAAQIDYFCPLDEEVVELFKKAYERFNYSARAFHKFVKLSRTLADLEEAASIRRQDVAAALMARDLDRDQARMMVI
ncbi:MAG: YifB family Mg chelatase-like AAA ATPase [Bacillota bacterium]